MAVCVHICSMCGVLDLMQDSRQSCYLRGAVADCMRHVT